MYLDINGIKKTTLDLQDELHRIMMKVENEKLRKRAKTFQDRAERLQTELHAKNAEIERLEKRIEGMIRELRRRGETMGQTVTLEVNDAKITMSEKTFFKMSGLDLV